MATYKITPDKTRPSITVTGNKKAVEDLNFAISNMIGVIRHRIEITGIIGKPETEHRAQLWQPYGDHDRTLADPEGHKADIDAYFQAINTPANGIKAGEIPAWIRTANEVFKKHIPVIDLRKTEDTATQEAAERQEIRDQQDKEQKERTATRQAEAAKMPALYPYLTPISATPGKSSHAAGAANMKAELIHNFPGVQFTVKSKSFSGGDDISAHWTDGPTAEQVRPIVDKYQEGHFDGITDYYDHHSTAFNDIFGGAKYTFGERTESPDLLIRAAIELGHKDVFTAEQYKALIDHTATGNDFYNYISGIFDHETTQTIYRHARTIATTPKTTNQPEGPQDPGPDDPPTGTPGKYGATIRKNAEKQGIEIKFTSKPDAETLTALKAAGFRWSRFNKVWYATDNARNQAAALRIAGNGTADHAETPETSEGPETMPQEAQEQAETDHRPIFPETKEILEATGRPAPAGTTVLNLMTGETIFYTCPPNEAVICADEQSRKNFNTWNYDYSKAKLSKSGKTWSAGDFAALADGGDPTEPGAIEDPKQADGDCNPEHCSAETCHGCSADEEPEAAPEVQAHNAIFAGAASRTDAGNMQKATQISLF